MAEKRVAPYGSWRSPITADLISSATIGLTSIVLDGADTYWIEMRPAEGGRCVIVRRTPDRQTSDVVAPPFSARTRVHEYGGGAFTVADGSVYFSNFADQRVYRIQPGRAAQPITPDADFRYADFVVDRARSRLLAVREDHTQVGREASNTIVALATDGMGPGRVLASGYDFYAAPRLSPDGSQLAWLSWNHPNMPWDGTELWVGALDAAGAVSKAERIAGGADESIFQPEWSPEGVLHFVSDRTGWWNIYRWRAGGAVEVMCSMEAEFGVPQWIFGASTYSFDAEGRLFCAYCQDRVWSLARLELTPRGLVPIQLPYTSVAGVRAASGRVCFVGGAPAEPTAVVEMDVATNRTRTLRRAIEIDVDPDYLSAPKAVEFPTENGLSANGFFYSPRNADYAPPPEERSPLIVMSHGGPTSATSTSLRLNIQFWTSRGFAVLDVDYGGSTGYGRAYRQRLDGLWGVVDVDDCVNSARYLVGEGLVDPNRLAITGGSAGGYTTLCALTFHDLFQAGASHYGVSDLEALARDTHKFESRYLDGLIGPYPATRDLYRARSPINFPDRLSRPVIFFQGLEDQIVPPNQAEMMVAALRAKGVPVAYLTFEGEQHGFRRSENVKRALEAELYFYSRIFGFEPADAIEPVEIENLPTTRHP